MKQRSQGIIGIILCVCLSSCATLRYGGAPEPSFDINQDLQQLATQFEQAGAITEFYKSPSPGARDRFITGRLVLINIRYIQFLRQSTSEKQLSDTGVEMLKMALSLAGASVEGAGVKTALAAAVAGVTGSKETIDKHYYYEQTIPALIAAMNAERKKTLIPILQGMRGNLTDYPLVQAITDLHNYYYAGTFVGAIQAIQTDAGEKERHQDEIIATLTPVSEIDVANKTSLTQAVGRLTSSDLERVKAALKTLDPNLAIAETFPEAQKQLQVQVRGARTSTRIAEVAKAFKDAGIEF